MYAYASLGDFHLAEDVAQEAFVYAYLDLPKPSDRVFRVRMRVAAGNVAEEFMLCYPVRILESVLKSG